MRSAEAARTDENVNPRRQSPGPHSLHESTLTHLAPSDILRSGFWCKEKLSASLMNAAPHSSPYKPRIQNSKHRLDARGSVPALCSLLLTLLMCVSLSAASAILYAREYIVQPIQEMSAPETEAAFRATRDLLVSKGLNPLSFGEKADPNLVAFRVAGSTAGFEFRQDWEDILELTYSVDKSFRLHLIRIAHQPEDFTDEYLNKFVEQTEGLIREATSKSVRLKLVPGKGT